MKKFLTSAAIIIILIDLLNPQVLHAQSEFGIKGGANYYGLDDNIESSSIFDSEMRGGVTFGVFYKKYNLLGPVGFQTELLYQSKGGKFYTQHVTEGSGYPNTFDYSYPTSGYWSRNLQRYHYLTLPLLLTISPVKYVDIYAGPEIGYLFSNSSSPHTWKPNRFFIGYAAGIAFQIDENTKLDFRFSKDITDVAKPIGMDGIKNFGWAFTIQRTLFRKQ